MNDALNAAKLQIQAKSLGVGVFLALFFGGLGLFYCSLILGLIGALIEIILFVITMVTFGFGIFLVLLFHVAAVIIAVIWINSHNKRLIDQYSK